MRWEEEVWFAVFQPFKLLNVDFHVACVGWDENCANACDHVASDEASITQQAHVAGMMAWGDEHLPLSTAEAEDFSIGEDSVACNAL